MQIQKDILKPVFVIMNRGGVSVLNYAHYGNKQSLTSLQRANYKRFKLTAEMSLPLLETKEVLISEEHLIFQTRYLTAC